MFEVSVEQTFAAGHALRNYKGKCENVHGHNWKVQLTLEGERLDEVGLLADFVEIKRAMDKVVGYLDHQFMNELKPFDTVNPSAENIARFFYEELARDLDRIATAPVRISHVKVWETDNASATYRP